MQILNASRHISQTQFFFVSSRFTRMEELERRFVRQICKLFREECAARKIQQRARLMSWVMV